MPLNNEQEGVVTAYRAAIVKANPSDPLQFSINYFNRMLEDERKYIKEQSGLALAKGITLFPEGQANFSTQIADSHESTHTLFKSPFSKHDPHTTNVINKEATVSTNDNPFRQDFSVDQDDNPIKKANSPLDPRNKIVDTLQHKKLPINFNALRRTSVSGETFEPNNFESDWKPDHYSEKTGEQLKRLENSIGKNFLFNQLESDSKALVINSLEEKKVTKGSQIIKQGDEGDYFYVVEKGTVEFFVNGEKVNSSGVGSSFGELALMYNSPRAASVVATTDCVLWALDRMTFRKILLGHSFKKRLMYDDFLKSVPILSSLTTYDRAKIADALETKVYEKDTVIIKEGDVGENFYFIEFGSADVIKEGDGVVATLKEHDYFGEVALINDLPRQATVKATSTTKVATLGKRAFQRLLGPIVDVLKLNDPTRTHNK